MLTSLLALAGITVPCWAALWPMLRDPRRVKMYDPAPPIYADVPLAIFDSGGLC